ncbi:MAG: IS200/IS605 family element transposase accessory protein TnpB [Desulfobacterales bacterium]|nr:IS200/IS605 family element transposase accessory protein TnpB [Desulfobacterales bacterium]
MKKTVKAKIRGLTKKQMEHLKNLCNNSKNLYNQALYAVRQEYLKTEDYLNYDALDKLMKKTVNLEGNINYKMLKAGVSQQILRRLDKNYRSFFALVKKCPDMKPKPPKYIRGDYHNLIFDSQRFQVRNGYAVLDKVVSVKIPGCIADKKIVQVEIIPKFAYFAACFVYEDDTEYIQVNQTDKVMGIDLGLNNLAVCATTEGDMLLINGRPLKSINQFYNKEIAGIKSVLDTRNGQKWSKRAQHLTDKRNNKINDYQHKASRKIVDFCIENEISKVVIGNVSHSIHNINLGKRNNQNFVNISLGQFVNKLEYKLEARGIEVVMSDESYTSKASFTDNDVLPGKYEPGVKHTFSGRRIKRGLYKAGDGTLVNADLNGAFNIIRKAVPEFNFNKLKDGIEGRFIPHCRLSTC